ncbi:Hypp5062 [Branchiostoma lanceolatum]|uniref:Hypp5062 protein n=1 Tax=Branchiostoma lanceolatum TaxID=7740 RepID=A0A8K0AD78_BRALA|nr:Hypp5062 [Branchiostoma lanceolatum]
MDAEARLRINDGSYNKKTPKSALLKRGSAVSKENLKTAFYIVACGCYYLLLLTHLAAVILSIYRNGRTIRERWCEKQMIATHPPANLSCWNSTWDDPTLSKDLGLPQFLIPKIKVSISLTNVIIMFVLMSKRALMWMAKNLLDFVFVIGLSHYLPPPKATPEHRMYVCTLALYGFSYLAQFGYCSVVAVFKMSFVSKITDNEFFTSIDILLTIAASGYNKMVWEFFTTKLYKPDRDIVSTVYYPLIIPSDDSYLSLDEEAERNEREASVNNNCTTTRRV